MRALLLIFGITIIGITVWSSAMTFTVNGGTIVGSVLGLVLVTAAWLMDVEDIAEDHPDAQTAREARGQW